MCVCVCVWICLGLNLRFVSRNANSPPPNNRAPLWTPRCNSFCFFCRNWLARKVTRHKRRLMTSVPNQRREDWTGKRGRGEHTRPDTSCCDETRTLPLFVLAICMCNSARFGHFSTFRLCRHDRHGGCCCCCYDCSFDSLSPDHQLTARSALQHFHQVAVQTMTTTM